jgi:hypothetical protein
MHPTSRTPQAVGNKKWVAIWLSHDSVVIFMKALEGTSVNSRHLWTSLHDLIFQP